MDDTLEDEDDWYTRCYPKLPKSSRPPLSFTEKSVLDDLVQVLTVTESQFCCGGTIKINAETLCLFYHDGRRQAHSLDLPPQHNEPVKELLNACTPSPHGRGNETVYDESYRLACELHQGSFALTEDILNENNALATIAALTSPREPGEANYHGIVARPYKLNAYAAGGFFKAHRDTPKSDRHIGSLVIALPISFQGGALRVSHEGREVLFDWGKDISSSTGEIKLPWAFLFSDVEHEVLPVTAGTRVTLAYDVFGSEEPMLAVSPVLDAKTLPLYPDLKAALHNEAFFPEGGKVAVALSHVYPMNLRSSSEAFASHLKGSDAAFYRVLSTLGVPFSLCAVFSPYDSGKFFNEAEKKLPQDGYGPSRYDGRAGFEILYTTKTIRQHYNDGTWDSGDHWEQGEAKLLELKRDATLDVDLIWARKPAKEEYSQSGHFAAYGNDVTCKTIYAAAALVLEIPPVGTSVRATS